MNLKNLCTIVAATAAFTFVGIAGGQTVFVWEGNTDSDWREANNWDVSAVPNDPSHKVIIRAPLTSGNDPILNLHSSNVTIGDLVIEDDGDLTVRTSGTTNKLMLTNSDQNRDGRLEIEFGGIMTVREQGQFEFVNAVNTHEIGGKIVINGAGSQLIVSENVTFKPYPGTPDVPGFVTGEHNSAEIRIASGKTLTSKITLNGAMDIDAASGTATLMNLGFVDANSTISGNQILTLGTNLDIFDCDNVSCGSCSAGPGAWKVSASDAKLLFLRDAVGGDRDEPESQLCGDFTYSQGGEFKFDAVWVATKGALIPGTGGGGVAVVNSACFFYNDFEDFICN